MDQLCEAATVAARQDLDIDLVEQQGEPSGRKFQVMAAVASGHLSPRASSSPKASPLRQQWTSQEENSVGSPASPSSINGACSSSPNLLSYPSRLLAAHVNATTSSPGEEVPQSLLTSTTIPGRNPLSDCYEVNDQLEDAVDTQMDDDTDDGDIQKHVDTFSDGVYLHSAADDSFIGVSRLSSSPPQDQGALDPDSVIVISSADNSEDDTSTAALQTNNLLLNAPVLPLRAAQNARFSQNENISTQGPTDPPQQPQGFRALSTLQPDLQDSDVSLSTSPRQSTFLRYSNLRKARGKSTIADFDVMITERESSTNSASARNSADPEPHTEPQLDTAAGKIIGIFEDWSVETNVADVQRLEWEEWGESQRNDKRTGDVWKKDLLLRNVKKQIQAKLRDGHVFILQKMPPAIYKAKPTSCAHPLCTAPALRTSRRRMQPGTYRLSLEPRSNLERPDIPLEAVYSIKNAERSAMKMGSVHGKGIDGVMWYCLSCVEDLWDGVGMLHAVPKKADFRPKRSWPSRRKVPDLALVAAGEACVLRGDRPSGSGSAVFPPRSANGPFSTGTANAAFPPGSTGADLSFMAAGERLESGQNRRSANVLFPPRPAFPPSSAHVAFSAKGPGAFLQVLPGSTGLLSSSRRAKGSSISNPGNRHQAGTLGSPSSRPRPGPPQRRFLLPHSRVQQASSSTVPEQHQRPDSISDAGPGGLIRSTMLEDFARDAAGLIPREDQCDGPSTTSSQLPTSREVDNGFFPSVPSLKPHDTWPSSIPNLASISQFIYPETRQDGTNTGYYALSSPQLCALRKWKAVHTYAAIFENQSNRAVMEGHELHYAYAEDELGEIYNNDRERKTRGVMEIGGKLIELSGGEVKGKKLSEVLQIVDERVVAEWQEQGWVDPGPRNGRGRARKRVKLTLRMEKREESSGTEMEFESDDGEPF